jgi:hypothetical protein
VNQWEEEKYFILFCSKYLQYLTPCGYCRLGWVDIGIGTKVPLGFVTYLSKVTKINEKSVGQNILGHAVYRGPKFFFHNMDFMGIKRCRILRRFQKYKLTLVTKCT